MRILFITSTRIGDAVLFSGILAWLVEGHPEARFTIVCGPLAAPLFEAVPGLDRLIVLRKMKHDRHWWRLWKKVAFRRWSLVVDMRRSVIPFTIPAVRRLRLPRDVPGQHKVVQAGRIIGADPPPDPKIWITDAHREAARSLVPDGAPVLGFAPITNWTGKEWPADRYIALARRLTGEGGILAGARLAVFAAPDERDAAQPVLEAVPADRRIDLAGKTDLLTAYACIARTALFVGNDSGLMHLAAASGVPTLGLFGPSPDALYGPWGKNTAVVRTPESFKEIVSVPGFDRTRQESLMDSLTVDRAAEAAAALWTRARPAHAGRKTA